MNNQNIQIFSLIWALQPYKIFGISSTTFRFYCNTGTLLLGTIMLTMLHRYWSLSSSYIYASLLDIYTTAGGDKTNPIFTWN